MNHVNVAKLGTQSYVLLHAPFFGLGLSMHDRTMSFADKLRMRRGSQPIVRCDLLTNCAWRQWVELYPMNLQRRAGSFRTPSSKARSGHSRRRNT